MAKSQQENAQRAETTSGASTNQGPGATIVPEEDMWNEQRLEEAMETLKEMHIQLRNLRTTIPRLIEPLTAEQPSPDVLYRKFTESINTANREVQEYRTLMTSEESSKVMAQAKKSRAANPSGIKPWKASDHPDWLTRDS